MILVLNRHVVFILCILILDAHAIFAQESYVVDWNQLKKADSGAPKEYWKQPIWYCVGNAKVAANKNSITLLGQGYGIVGALCYINKPYTKIEWKWQVKSISGQATDGKGRDQPLHVVAILEPLLVSEKRVRAVAMTWCKDMPSQRDLRSQTSYNTPLIKNIRGTGVSVVTVLTDKQFHASQEVEQMDLVQRVRADYPEWKEWDGKVHAIAVFADLDDAGGSFESEVCEIKLTK